MEERSTSLTLALIVVFRVGAPAWQARSATGCGWPRSSRKGRASSRSGSPAGTSARLRAQAGQFFLWRFLARGHWWTAHPVLALGGAGRALAADHGEGARRSQREAAARSEPGHAGRRRRAVRRLHRRRPAPRQDAARSPAASGSPRSARSSRTCAATWSSSTARSRRGRPRPPRRARADRRRPCTTSSATTPRRAASGCSRPSTCSELVPDVAAREVFLCGPPGMTAAIERTVRPPPCPPPPRPRRAIRSLMKGIDDASSCRPLLLSAAGDRTANGQRAGQPPRRRSSSRRKFTGAAAQAEPLGLRPGDDHRPQDDHDRERQEEGHAADDRSDRDVAGSHVAVGLDQRAGDADPAERGPDRAEHQDPARLRRDRRRATRSSSRSSRRSWQALKA